MTRSLRRFADSAAAMLALAAVAGLAVLLAAYGISTALPGLLLLLLAGGIGWMAKRRPGPALNVLTVVGLLTALAALLAHGLGNVWLAFLFGGVVLAGLVDEPLRQRLAPRIRAVQLPGIPSDPRPELPGPFAAVLLVLLGFLGLFLLLCSVVVPPRSLSLLLLIGVIVALVPAALKLRDAVRATRRGVADADASNALQAYAPQFYLYFSGPPEGEYQVRMWLPYLERLGVPFAVLTREPKLLPLTADLTGRPVVLIERLAAMDAAMVPSVRAMFYVNTHHQCVDGVRFLDVTHVHLNHGDSDKPSSYHPMIAMFDRIFLAGQAAVDRFTRNGVQIPSERVVLVGRPQTAEISSINVDPLDGTPTVLYAPTWRGGVDDMTFGSLHQGEKVVRALLDRGVRVAFRPHPFSARERESAQQVARIDALLTEAGGELPHRTSADTARHSVVQSLNASDALVTDVSSLASDYLQSGKPLAVTNPGNGAEQHADPASFPVLNAAYVLDLDSDFGAGLDELLGTDSRAGQRADMRSYYLGDQPDSAAYFVDCVREAISTKR